MREPIYTSAEAVVASTTTAAGLGDLRSRFAWDETYDLLFAIGFPHVRWISGADPDDPKAAALDRMKRGWSPHTIAWPLRTARTYARLMGGPFLRQLRNDVTTSAKGEAMRAEDGPLDAEEAGRILKYGLTKRLVVSDRANLEILVLLVEALVGPSVVAHSMVDTLERIKPASWSRVRGSGAFPQAVADLINGLGFVLLRVEASEARALRARLVALHEDRDPNDDPSRMLDGILHGAAGLDRSAHRLAGGGRNPWLYAHGTGAPTAVADAAAHFEKGMMLDARLVFLGGRDVLTSFAGAWSRLGSGAEQRFFLDSVGRIRDEKTVEIIKAMAARSKVRKVAAAWLDAL